MHAKLHGVVAVGYYIIWQHYSIRPMR